MNYNWQQSDWKKFSYDFNVIEGLLYAFSEKVGLSKGISQALSKQEHTKAMIDVLVAEAIKNSEIEGEFLSRKDVVSSIKNNLGLSGKKIPVKDINAKGMAELVAQIHNEYNLPLTEEMLFQWHELVFLKNPKIKAGKWRSHSEPMQVISGSIGKETIHFEAPPSKLVPKEMAQFIKWFNDSGPNGKNEIKYAPIRCAITHLYFETIHPFEDGNGRIGRLVAEKALFQSLDYPILISLSATIEANKKKYYEALKNGQRSNEVTQWLLYFIETILNAMDSSTSLINFTLEKAKLFDHYGEKLNERQTKVLKRMLSEGPDGFKGGMSANKYMRLTKASKATSTRDLQRLEKMGVFKAIGGGRSTSYVVQFPE